MAGNQFIPITQLELLPSPPGVDMFLAIQAAGVTYKVEARKFPLITDMLLTWGGQQAALPGSKQLLAGANITLTDTGAGFEVSAVGFGLVDNIVAGTGIDVDNTDSTQPVVSLDSASIASLALADTALQPADILGIQNATVTTETNETATFANSRRWVAGANTVINTATPGQIAIDVVSIGQVDAVIGTVNQIDVDSTDPANPILSLAAAVLARLTLANTALQAADIGVTVQGYSSKLAAYAGGDTPSAFTLGIVDSVDAAAWRAAIGAGNAVVAGADTQVQFNDGGSFGADAGLTYAKSTDLLSAGGLNVTGANVPANGIYLVGANTIGFATNTTARGSINAAGNWVITAPSSGASLSINSLTSEYFLRGTDSTTTFGIYLNAAAVFGTFTNHPILFTTNSTTRLTIAAPGNVTIAAPGSGVALTVATGTGATETIALTATAGNRATLSIAGNGTTPGSGSFDLIHFSNNDAYVLNRAAANLFLSTNGTTRITIGASGNVTIAAPGSSDALVINGLTTSNVLRLVSTGANDYLGFGWNIGVAANAWNIFTHGTDPFAIGTQGAAALTLKTQGAEALTISTAQVVSVNDAGTMREAGFRALPSNTQTGTTYSVVQADNGKVVYANNNSAKTFTLNQLTAGSVVTFVNDGSGGGSTITLTQGSGVTIYWFNGVTRSAGNRTLAYGGVCTATWYGPTVVFLWGNGIT